jgi:hypothetical protein
MAIDVNKPVYVFDQERNKWYTNIDKDWIEIGTPTLTPNFAGIGTRNINQNGIEAIRDVYENTFREIDKMFNNFNSQELSLQQGELTGVDLLALYDQGEKRILEILNTLDDLTAEEKQTYLNEFAQ